MLVKELIAELEQLDPNAEVLIASQDHYPWEFTLRSVVTREDVERREDDEREHPRDEPRAPEPGTAPTDVFLVEGHQLRSGSKAIWRARR
jgi:hypothetical protein